MDMMKIVGMAGKRADGMGVKKVVQGVVTRALWLVETWVHMKAGGKVGYSAM
jgi:hypothetical protein